MQSKAQRGRCTPTFRDALRAEKEVAGSRISSGCTFQAFQWRERESLPSFSQLPFFFAHFCAFKLLDLSYFCYLNFQRDMYKRGQNYLQVWHPSNRGDVRRPKIARPPSTIAVSTTSTTTTATTTSSSSITPGS